MDLQTPSVTSPIQYPKRFPVLLVLLSLLILILLASTAYLAYQNMQLQKQITDLSNKPTPTITEAPTQVGTASWKTYSTSRGFTFRYPNNYEVAERVPGFFVITSPQNSGTPQAGVSIETRLQNPYDNYQTANEYFYNNFLISDDHVVQDQTDKTVSQVIWRSLQGLGKNDQLQGLKFLIGVKQYKTGVIVVEGLSNSIESHYFDQILSTFKFLGPGAAAPTPPTTYTCPPTGWVDCEPVMDAAKQKACSEKAMAWYKANCPDFKGGAL